jgi:hypothetical protein
VVALENSLKQVTTTMLKVVFTSAFVSAAVLWILFPTIFRYLYTNGQEMRAERACYCVVKTGSSIRTTYTPITWPDSAIDFTAAKRVVRVMPAGFCFDYLVVNSGEMARSAPATNDHHGYYLGTATVPCEMVGVKNAITYWLELTLVGSVILFAFLGGTRHLWLGRK